MFLFTSQVLNVGLTIALIIIYIGLIVLVNKIVIKSDKEMKKGATWFYLILFVVLIAFIGLALWFFGVDFIQEAEKVWTNIKTGFEQKVGALIGTIIVIFLTMLINRAVAAVLRKLQTRKSAIKKRASTIIKITRSIIRYIVEIVALLVILSLWGVNVGPALAGLGILGLVIGLGAQKLIQDFIAGFFIIFEHHFDVGDVVEVNGFKGEVIDIGLKTTRIKNWKQDIKIISNGSITELMNYSIAHSMAVVEFGISYDSDIQKTTDILNEELPKFKNTNPDIVEAPVLLGVTDLADSSVNMRVICRTQPEKQYAVERSLRQRIKEILDENGIEIPFPQIVVHNGDK